MKKILVADDEQTMRFLISATLGVEGYELVEAVDGREALDKARTLVPDLLILDVMMPEIDGFEVCRQLKGDPATQGIMTIMLTAKGQQSDRELAKKAGADHFLAKPFRPLELLELVNGLLKV